MIYCLVFDTDGDTYVDFFQTDTRLIEENNIDFETMYFGDVPQIDFLQKILVKLGYEIDEDCVSRMSFMVKLIPTKATEIKEI